MGSILEDEVINDTDTSLAILSSTLGEGSFWDARTRRQKRKDRRRDEMHRKEKEKEKEKDKQKGKDKNAKDENEKEEFKKDKAGKKVGVCRHFSRYNNCKFRIGGKGCKFHHPKICTRSQK